MGGRRGSRQEAGKPGSGPAPPRPGSLDEPLHTDALPVSAPCPFCRSTETEQLAAFGGAVSTSQYWCRRCRTAFEFMKWRAP